MSNHHQHPGDPLDRGAPIPNELEVPDKLEARIVAWVLGEASDFEREQLEQQITQRPELADFRDEMQRVHSLMTDLGSEQSNNDLDGWKLSPQRRQKLLDTIGDKSAAAKPVAGEPDEALGIKVDTNRPSVTLMPSADAQHKQRNSLGTWVKVLAAICLLGILVGLLLPGIGASKNAARVVVKAMPRQEERYEREFESEEDGVPAPYYSQDDVSSFAQSFPLEEQLSERRFESSLTLGRTRNRPEAPAATAPESGDQKARSVGRRSEIEAEEFGIETGKSLPIGGGVGGSLSESMSANRPQSPARSHLNRFSRRNSPSADRSGNSIGNLAGEQAEFYNAPDLLALGDAAEAEAKLERPNAESWSRAPSRRRAEEFGGDPIAHPAPRIVAQLGQELSRTLDAGGDFDAAKRLDSPARLEASKSVKELSSQPSAVDGRESQPSSQEQSDHWGFQGLAGKRETFDDNEEFGQRPSKAGSGTRKPSTGVGAGTKLMLGAEIKQEQDSLRKKLLEPDPIQAPKPRSLAGGRYPKPPTARPESTILSRTLVREQHAGKNAFSTFSLHVGDVSFKLAQNALAGGNWPAPAKIRIEEFVNAFDYGDPLPSDDEKVACKLEQAAHPLAQQRNLMRVSLRTAAVGRSHQTPLCLTFLLDNSGSMERSDRRQTVRRALSLLCQQLAPTDRVTLISFARTPRLLADKVAGKDAQQLIDLVNNLPSEGGTNLESALNLAFEKALEQKIPGAQNRVILLTDGAVNLGDANPDRLSGMVTSMRQKQIAFDAAGICADGLNDEVLQSLARRGDGRYYLLASADDTDEGFVRQIAGALRPSAKDVKVQVWFNPQRVGYYKLLGFEKHRLRKQDFRNDKIDAAEMTSAEAGVAMYQFEAKPDGEGDVGTVSVRFRDLSSGQMVENTWPIPYQPNVANLEQSEPSLRVATVAALFAAVLQGDPIAQQTDLKTLSQWIRSQPDALFESDRVQQLATMIEQARLQMGQ